MLGVYRSWGGVLVAFALAVAVGVPSGAAFAKKAKVYPTTTCASS
jgi:hypothetical protein